MRKVLPQRRMNNRSAPRRSVLEAARYCGSQHKFQKEQKRNVYTRVYRSEIKALKVGLSSFPQDFTNPLEYNAARCIYYRYIPYLSKYIWGSLRSDLVYMERMYYEILSNFHFIQDRGALANRLRLCPWVYLNLHNRADTSKAL